MSRTLAVIIAMVTLIASTSAAIAMEDRDKARLDKCMQQEHCRKTLKDIIRSNIDKILGASHPHAAKPAKAKTKPKPKEEKTEPQIKVRPLEGSPPATPGSPY